MPPGLHRHHRPAQAGPPWPDAAALWSNRPRRADARDAQRQPGTRIIADTLVIAALALLADAVWGYPDRLLRHIGHPVMWIGALIARLDRRLNRDSLPERRRRLNGVLALLLLGLLAGTLPAQRSLWQHVRAVLVGLQRSGLAGGRDAVSRIVGRDPHSLDEAGVVRAAIESLAENFSDGVVAPLLWCVLLGLPGIVLYKAVNTADSMIGHLTPRHASFGWASARLDDVLNLPASRLSALWLVLAASRPPANASRSLATVLRDARRHRSPNAGWPEAAMAGALDLRLAGPRTYAGTIVPDAWMGRGRDAATADDLRRALILYRCACTIQAALLLPAAILLALGGIR